MGASADDLRQEMLDVFERRARGELTERRYERRLTELSVELCRAIAERCIDEDERILAEHHVVHSHLKLSQPVLDEPEQATASYFATGKRLLSIQGTVRPGRPSRYDDSDGTVVIDVAYGDIQTLLPQRQYRWGEALAGASIMLVSLAFGRLLQVTAPLLLLLGTVGLLHALVLPTRWLELVRRRPSDGPPLRIHGLARRSGRALLKVLRASLHAAPPASQAPP
jgi:hypothetical protein